MGTILVTGGAGYVGAQTCKALAAAGHVPVTYDDLSTGWRDAVKFGPLEEGCVTDARRLAEAFETHRPDAVMHLAALSDVTRSVAEPERYMEVNADGTRLLAEAALAAGCETLVFSSTCSVYGDGDGEILDETHAKDPINPYGTSKSRAEDHLARLSEERGLRVVSLRYFNVAGADADGEIGEHHRPETHLIPLILDAALGRRPAIRVFGSDYDTRDGTCVRDYVHVMDIAGAHLAALCWLGDGNRYGVFNIGGEQGATVREVITACERVTGRPVPVEAAERRPGDPASLIASSARARATLAWTGARSSLDRMIADAWRWHQSGHYDR